MKLIQEVGSNNPWNREWSCPRRTCLPCQGQAILGAEEEKEALRMVAQGQEEQKTATWPREDTRSLPGCTSEGCNYVLECLHCRNEGIKRRYYGETSRSPFQRGNEHMREISDGLASHPLTIHFREEHGGRQQEVLMRILSRHISSLDRQVVELLNILKASRTSEECLNLKSEWGGVNTARPPSPQT